MRIDECNIKVITHEKGVDAIAGDQRKNLAAITQESSQQALDSSAIRGSQSYAF